MREDFPPQPITADMRQRSDFVLGQFRGALYIGVKFGTMWRPARVAHATDIRYFK